MKIKGKKRIMSQLHKKIVKTMILVLMLFSQAYFKPIDLFLEKNSRLGFKLGNYSNDMSYFLLMKTIANLYKKASQNAYKFTNEDLRTLLFVIMDLSKKEKINKTYRPPIVYWYSRQG